MLISMFKGLTFRTYEGKPCTSGILCLQGADSEKVLHLTTSQRRGWRFEPLPQGIVLDPGFFEAVGSYRYVDGVAKFYVADVGTGASQPPRLVGTLEMRKRSGFLLPEVASYAPLQRLLASSADSFILTANRNREIDVVSTHDNAHILRWTRGRWRVVNLSLLMDAARAAANTTVATALVRAALTLSHLRLGTLILVPENAKDLPEGGSIDRSAFGKTLRRQIRSRTITELVNSGQFINALSSDGLTAVAANGRILDTGRILSDVRLGRGKVGGARTAAARAASRKGLVIKVSADGPIALFRDGKAVYETA